MMMNNKTLIKEVDELKDVLSKGDAEIPSFWVCMWPGLCLVIWNIFCALISVRSEYYDVKYIFWVLIFPGAVGLILLLGVANARSLFLSVPKSFREKSVIYRFFSKKLLFSFASSIEQVSVIFFFSRCFSFFFTGRTVFRAVIMVEPYCSFIHHASLIRFSSTCIPLLVISIISFSLSSSYSR